MRPKCYFNHNGKPTTMPGTDDDQKRIALSQWVTDLLVRYGDEAQGAYQTPGANGYAAWEVKEAKQRLAPLKPKGKKEKKNFALVAVGERVKPRNEPAPAPEPPSKRILLAGHLHDFQNSN